MRAVPQSLQDALSSGVTTLCRCWSVARTDGVVLGFTDHDRPLNFEGVAYEADSGLNAEALESATGLSVDTQSVTGALRSAAITDEDIERGLYDGAEVLQWLVDWRDPVSRLLLSRGHIGEIRRSGSAFEAEITGLKEFLNQPVGRAFMHGCGHVLGDARCGVDLLLPVNVGAGTVSGLLDTFRFKVSSIEGFAPDWFSGGNLTWSAGANAGTAAQVKTHALRAGEAIIELWLTPAMAVAVGDAFAVTAGCDKAPETCRAKFSNLLNYGGFPHMPGDDWVAGYVSGEGEHDGGSLFGR